MMIMYPSLVMISVPGALEFHLIIRMRLKHFIFYVSDE